MHILRKGLLVICASLLPGLLLLSALDIGIVHVIGSPTPIKNSLSNSGIYSSVVSSLLSQSKDITGSGSNIPFSDSAIKMAADYAFPPSDIKKYTETVIDSSYRWLDGKTPLPDFKLDLSTAKTRFAERVASVAKDRAAKLPACGNGNISLNFDAFAATCLPRFVTPAQVSDQIKSDVMSGQGFLDNPVITAGDIKDSNGQPIFSDKLSGVPNNYQAIKKSPIALILLSCVMLAGMIFMSGSRLGGIKRGGIILVTVGLFILILSRGIDQIAAHKVDNIKVDNPVLQSKLRVLAADILHKVDKNYWIAGTSYTILGIAAISGSVLAGRKTNPATEPVANGSPPKEPVQ